MKCSLRAFVSFTLLAHESLQLGSYCLVRWS